MALGAVTQFDLATQAALTALTTRVTTVEAKIATIQAAVTTLQVTPVVSPSSPAGGPPSGVLLFAESCDDANFAARGWYDDMPTIVATPTHGGTGAIEAHFPVGGVHPAWGYGPRHLFAPTPTLYVSYWAKYSDNWVGSGQAFHPHEFYVLSDADGDWQSPSDSQLNVYIEHVYQNGGVPHFEIQDNQVVNVGAGTLPNNLTGVTEQRSVGACNSLPEAGLDPTCYATGYSTHGWYSAKMLMASQVAFQPTPGPGYKGNWNHVEVYLAMNSVAGGKGMADGMLECWFNGALLVDRHDILFRTGARPTLQFKQFMIGPYMNSSPVDQTAWYDDFVVGTGKP